MKHWQSSCLPWVTMLLLHSHLPALQAWGTHNAGQLGLPLQNWKQIAKWVTSVEKTIKSLGKENQYNCLFGWWRESCLLFGYIFLFPAGRHDIDPRLGLPTQTLLAVWPGLCLQSLKTIWWVPQHSQTLSQWSASIGDPTTFAMFYGDPKESEMGIFERHKIWGCCCSCVMFGLGMQ